MRQRAASTKFKQQQQRDIIAVYVGCFLFMSLIGRELVKQLRRNPWSPVECNEMR